MPDQEKFVHPYNDESGRWEDVATVELGGYSWSMACVWRDKATGRLYGDTDSGCSCYGPFDESGWGASEYNLGDLTEVAVVRDGAELLEDISGKEGGVSTEERRDFVHKVAVALRVAR